MEERIVEIPKELKDLLNTNIDNDVLKGIATFVYLENGCYLWDGENFIDGNGDVYYPTWDEISVLGSCYGL